MFRNMNRSFRKAKRRGLLLYLRYANMIDWNASRATTMAIDQIKNGWSG